MAADVMWRELDMLGQKKPLIVSMGSTAASGGYFVAVPARTIYAEPLSITGSIGIFYGKADLSGLLQKLGVNVEVYKTMPHADAESWFRPYSDDERKMLDVKIRQFYDVFLDRVARGRHMTKAQVDAVGQGRVWTGQEAIEHRLIDKLGGLREALAEGRAAAGLPDDAPLMVVPPPESSLLDKVLDLAGLGRAGTLSLQGLPLQAKDVARALAPLAIFPSDVALARMEWVPVEDPGTDDAE
jgi:protease-4